MSRILAIDHGSRLVGWAVAEDGQPSACGLLRLEENYPQSLMALFGFVLSQLGEYHPDTLALEKPMSLRNGRIAQMLIEHYTACKLAAVMAQIPLIEIAPPTLKLIVAGAGNADKQAVADALVHKWGMDLDAIAPPEYYKAGKRKGQLKSRSYDPADACALALAAHVIREREAKCAE